MLRVLDYIVIISFGYTVSCTVFVLICTVVTCLIISGFVYV